MGKKKGKKNVVLRTNASDEFNMVQEKPTKIDGKWGWFIVFNAFICNMVVDGMQYTFANFLTPIETTFHKSSTVVSLIGSLLSGFYNFAGPLGSALGNKFGLRMVCITGSITASAGLSLSYFAMSVEYLYFFYGVLGGLGFGMVYMASVITTSIYFEKYRALAASISVCGTGVGTFIFAPMGNFLVNTQGWRLALVIEGAIVLICIICALCFKPVNIVAVVPLSEEPSMTPEEMEVIRRGSVFYEPDDGRRRTLPNIAYPTLKEALGQGLYSPPLSKTATETSLRIPEEERRQTATNSPRNHTEESIILAKESRMQRIYSIVPSADFQAMLRAKPRGKQTCGYKCRQCCRNCCFNFWHCRLHHRDLNLGDRPLYRDDVFYEGRLENLSNYSSQEKLEYRFSVMRIPATRDIEEHATQKCCVCHHAFIRACITMLGLHLLKSKIFVFLCISSFLYTMGLYIPYVFIRKLSDQHEIDEAQSVWFISVIGLSNTAGRLCSGILKSFVKVNASVIVLICLIGSGAFSFIFILTPTTVTLFTFSAAFGFFTAPFISLRPVIIVEFLGLEKLTNAFGLVLLSQGIASILGPPVAGFIEEYTKNDVYVFYFSGSLMLLSGLMLLISVLLHFKG